MIEGIFVDGLIFSLMVIGILISYRILDFADLTCDGSVATGAAVATMAIVGGSSHLHRLRFRLYQRSHRRNDYCGDSQQAEDPRPSGGNFDDDDALYSINLRILGNKANVPLLRSNPLYEASSLFLLLPTGDRIPCRNVVGRAGDQEPGRPMVSNRFGCVDGSDGRKRADGHQSVESIPKC